MRARLMRVSGHSMMPALRPGDLVWVRDLAPARPPLRRDDLVVARPAALGGKACVKRIAGLPHERVALGGRARELGPDEYLLLGDGAGDSLDSRQLGPVPRGELVGRVRMRLWPRPSRTC